MQSKYLCGNFDVTKRFICRRLHQGCSEYQNLNQTMRFVLQILFLGIMCYIFIYSVSQFFFKARGEGDKMNSSIEKVGSE